MLLFMNIPFAAVFVWVIYTKGFADQAPSDTAHGTLQRLEASWLGFVIVVFVVVNLASIAFMPTVVTAQKTGDADVEVDVEAGMWYYQMSEREFETGTTVTFHVKSVDTVHSFALYNPDDTVEFTQMLIPGQQAKMTYTFDEPGTYTVRCLEYCGTGHALMRDEITVVEGS